MGNTLFRLSGCMVILPVLAISFTWSRGVSPAEEPPAAKTSDSSRSIPGEHLQNMSKMFKGTVMDVIDAGRYVYIKIDIGEKRVWVAVPVFEGKPGDTILVPPGVPVADFQSKKLNRKFGMIYFVGGVRCVDEGPAGSPLQTPIEDYGSEDVPAGDLISHPPMEELAEDPGIDIGNIERTDGWQTVFEIITGRKSLDGKEIRVRAKVVKFTPNVMGKNWLHVRDGSGQAGTNNLIVTTNAVAKVGDVVSIRGTVRTDPDLGPGPRFKVIIEDAEVTAE